MRSIPQAQVPRAPRTAQENRIGRDIAWDRVIFRAPSLVNFQMIFDPLPFRTQSFKNPRPVR